MSTPSWDPKEPARNAGAADIMIARGITRVPVDYFHYKSFRYTNLDDAIAQANRDALREGPPHGA